MNGSMNGSTHDYDSDAENDGSLSVQSAQNGQPGKKEKLSKNQKRRQKKKQQKQGEQQSAEVTKTDVSSQQEALTSSAPPSNVEIEYVDADPLQDAPEFDPTVAEEFRKIFDKFTVKEEPEEDEEQLRAQEALNKAAQVKKEKGGEDDEDSEDDGKPKLSRKQRKLRSRLSVAELKQMVNRSDVVEAHDVTAADPRLLVYLKAYKNTVPVPRHWCHKRKYLQGKRGIEKKPFELPDYIAKTGIQKLRETIEEQDAQKKAKQKQRERVQPKMGKMDIDYQKLHDAFFRFQTKPKLSRPGDLYYEGKEFEIKLKEKRPGVLSQELRDALGMVDGAPPPWLINMQRYGPPPSYPSLRIPGLNAPIPPGGRFGYHVGGWGKPPVDETGNPLYGDVFGTKGDDFGEGAEPVDKAHWGEVVESDEEEEEEEDEDVEMGDGTETPMDMGVSSVSGLETPDTMMDLRKRAGLDTPDTSGVSTAPKELFRVIEQQGAAVGQGLFGTDRRYNVAGVGAAAPQALDVALNPDQLEEQLNDEAFAQDAIDKYQAAQQILGDESEAGKRKRKPDKGKEGKTKKPKDFKF